MRQSVTVLASSSDCVYSTSAGFVSGCFLLVSKVSVDAVDAVCYFETFSFSSSGRFEFATTSISKSGTSAAFGSYALFLAGSI